MADQSEGKDGLHASDLKRAIQDNVDAEKLKTKFEVSHFGANAVIRGMQLTLVGAHRALQNPALFNNDHYKQAATAVVAGLGIRLLVSLPVCQLFQVERSDLSNHNTPLQIIGIRLLLWTTSLFYSLESVTWDDAIVEGLEFIEEYVLQIPFFLMTLMRYVVPTLDDL